MSYQNEYYKIIENEKFYNLPEQSFINNDQRIALAIINNYRNRKLNNEYEQDNYQRFKEIKFNEILDIYKNNISFWKKANIQNYLLDEDFRNQFPEICFQFLTDKDFLLEFFVNNKSELILKSLNNLVSEEEFKKLEKSYILSSYGSIENIKKYESDQEFITTLIKKRPSIFSELSDESKNNEQILLAYLEYEPSILTFDKQNQNKLFITWLKLHKKWDMKIIDQLDFEYLKPLMFRINKTNNQFFIQKLLSKNVKKYKEVIIDFFTKNNNESFFFQMIKEKSLQELMPIIKELDCTQYLQTWLNNLSYKKFDKLEFKILEIMKDYPELSKQWENSFDCMIVKLISNNEPLSFENFRESLNKQLEKLENNTITYEKIESNMIQLKKYLPIEILKERKIPNNHIVEYLQNIKFEEKFEEKLFKEKKLKI